MEKVIIKTVGASNTARRVLLIILAITTAALSVTSGVFGYLYLKNKNVSEEIKTNCIEVGNIFKSTYCLGEELETFGGTINYYDQNGEKTEIALTPSMITNFGTTEIGTQEMKISYEHNGTTYTTQSQYRVISDFKIDNQGYSDIIEIDMGDVFNNGKLYSNYYIPSKICDGGKKRIFNCYMLEHKQNTIYEIMETINNDEPLTIIFDRNIEDNRVVYKYSNEIISLSGDFAVIKDKNTGLEKESKIWKEMFYEYDIVNHCVVQKQSLEEGGEIYLETPPEEILAHGDIVSIKVIFDKKYYEPLFATDKIYIECKLTNTSTFVSCSANLIENLENKSLYCIELNGREIVEINVFYNRDGIEFNPNTFKAYSYNPFE